MGEVRVEIDQGAIEAMRRSDEDGAHARRDRGCRVGVKGAARAAW